MHLIHDAIYASCQIETYAAAAMCTLSTAGGLVAASPCPVPSAPPAGGGSPCKIVDAQARQYRIVIVVCGWGGAMEIKSLPVHLTAGLLVLCFITLSGVAQNYPVPKAHG
jgi:hypothetical protein